MLFCISTPAAAKNKLSSTTPAPIPSSLNTLPTSCSSPSPPKPFHPFPSFYIPGRLGKLHLSLDLCPISLNVECPGLLLFLIVTLFTLPSPKHPLTATRLTPPGDHGFLT